MNESTKNQKSAPRQPPCIILMHRTADRNNIRLVYRHSEHRREQDPGRAHSKVGLYTEWEMPMAIECQLRADTIDLAKAAGHEQSGRADSVGAGLYL